MVITLSSKAFDEGQTIARRYTGDGKDVSPPLSWSDVPPDAKEIALICDDPDAPTPEPWVHWVIYRISPTVTELPEGIPPIERLSTPNGALQGKNSWGRIGYGGPAPPKGHGLHHYHFKLYALDTALNLRPGADNKALLAAMAGHVLAEGELIGTYER
jgi:Raf kinase inhibitor-like YbhB/YbcL family protein